MTTEDQDILAKISQLAGEFATILPVCSAQLQLTSLSGQINRHKNGQSLDQQAPAMPSPSASHRGSKGSLIVFNKHRADRTGDYSQASAGWRPGRGAYASRGYTRGGRPQVHRNRTLVINGSNNENASPNSDTPESASGNTTPGGWITKHDRHRQLINSSVFERESQNRAKAMEETRRQKLKQRNDLEKSKLSKHLQRLRGTNFTSSRPADIAGNYELEVQGIRFRVAKNGSKLVKVPGEKFHFPRIRRDSHICLMSDSRYIGDLNAAKSTPKDAIVGGVRFRRSKNGNLVRSSIVKAQRYGRPLPNAGIGTRTQSSANRVNSRKTGIIKKINEPCKKFTTTGNPFLSRSLICRLFRRRWNFGFQLTLPFVI